jgi:hypothetical protein
MTRTTDTLHEDLDAFMIIRGRILLRMGNILVEVVETLKHILYAQKNPPPNPENCSVNEIMWRYKVQKDKPWMTM